MKVKIEMTIDVNVENWKLDFGMETSAEVREDVRLYVRTQVDDHLHSLNYGSVV